MAVAKQTPQDRLGIFVMIDGRLQVIEYSDLPDDVAEQRDADGSLEFWAGSIADSCVQRRVSRAGARAEGRAAVSRRAEESAVHRRRRPNWSSRSEPNALKFERFIFDLLPHAKNPFVVEYAEEDSVRPAEERPGRAEGYARVRAPVHDRPAPQLAEAAGANVADGVPSKSARCWALDAEAVAELVEPGRRFEKSRVSDAESDRYSHRHRDSVDLNFIRGWFCDQAPWVCCVFVWIAFSAVLGIAVNLSERNAITIARFYVALARRALCPSLTVTAPNNIQAFAVLLASWLYADAYRDSAYDSANRLTSPHAVRSRAKASRDGSSGAGFAIAGTWR